jgi:sulfate permease, SulP family
VTLKSADVTARGLSGTLRDTVHPRALLPSVVAGSVGGLLAVIWSISDAALIFSGPLASRVSQGIALGLISAIVLSLVAAFGSSITFASASSQESLTVICAVMAASLVSLLTPQAESQILPTVVALLALTTLVTGVVFFALGTFHLGRLVRFVPFPVMGGFLAGTGWLIVGGSEQVLTGIPLTRDTLTLFTHGAPAGQIALGVLFALVQLTVSWRYTHFLVMPALLLVFGAIFYFALALTNTPLSHAEANGWLLGPFATGTAYPPLGFSSVRDINWSALLSEGGSIATLAVVATAGLLLNVTGLEVAIEDDLDVDRELQVMGIGNLMAGAAGGLAGFHNLSSILMARKMGAVGRLVGIVSALVAVLTLVLGIQILTYVPRFLLGGLLLFVGTDLLVEWIYRGWFRMTHVDFATVVIILIVVGAWGLLQALLVGVVLGILGFVITYSRTGAIKYELSGATYSSNVDRSFRQRRLLAEHGESIYILGLQGFLFFGTTSGVLDHIRHRLDQRGVSVRFVVLDCRLVSGVDASIPLTFAKLRTLAEKRGLLIVLTGLTPPVYSALVRGDVLDAAGTISVFPALDLGVEWCETEILQVHGEIRAKERPLVDQLEDLFQSSELAFRLMAYLDRTELDAGCDLVRQGTPADDFFLVESGSLSVQLDRSDGTAVHLRTTGAGALLGELGFYRGSPRSASVVATERSVLYRISRQSLSSLRAEDPDLAIAFTEVIVRLLAERVTTSNETVSALMR